MISYRDMTFCKAQCANETCSRKLTDQVWKEAAEWWGDEYAPVAVADFRDHCEEYVEVIE